jgi:translocator protein
MVIMPAWMRIILASGLTFAAGAISALYVSESTVSWYASLNRPLIFAMPLSVVFFVLVVSYALISIASSLMWIHDPKPWDFRGWVPLFFTHLLMNMAWLILFFGYHVIFVTLIIGFMLALFVLMLTAAAWTRSRLAFWLLMPYLAWTLYALGMNMAVWINN